MVSISVDTTWYQFTLMLKTSPLVAICLGCSFLWCGTWRSSILLWWSGFYRLVCVFTPRWCWTIPHAHPAQLFPLWVAGEIGTQVVLALRLLIHYPIYPSWEREGTHFSRHCGWQITWYLHRPSLQKLDFYCRQTLRRSCEESQQRWWWGWRWLS